MVHLPTKVRGTNVHVLASVDEPTYSDSKAARMGDPSGGLVKK